jgi:hypothetical protein
MSEGFTDRFTVWNDAVIQSSSSGAVICLAQANGVRTEREQGVGASDVQANEPDAIISRKTKTVVCSAMTNQ